ncbi:MAG: hypothetical protein KY442_10895, partial [Proteobacteria bacterium]|nr:hypothetical protein [Pseudomonadota bacterium]
TAYIHLRRPFGVCGEPTLLDLRCTATATASQAKPSQASQRHGQVQGQDEFALLLRTTGRFT